MKQSLSLKRSFRKLTSNTLPTTHKTHRPREKKQRKNNWSFNSEKMQQTNDQKQNDEKKQDWKRMVL